MRKILHYLFIGVAAGLLASGGYFAYAAISQQVGINGLDANGVWQGLKTAPNSDANLNTNYIATSLFGFNGTTYDRVRASVNADAQTPTGFLNIMLYGFNNATWDRVHAGFSTDAAAASGFLNNFPYIYNGATLDRRRAASTANLTATTQLGVSLGMNPVNESCTSTPAAGTQATCTLAAGTSTQRHVAMSVTACANDTAAATASQVVNLRDGATGAGTVLLSFLIGIPVPGDSKCISVPIQSKPGSATTAMTLEFAAAPAGTGTQSVTLTATKVQ